MVEWLLQLKAIVVLVKLCAFIMDSEGIGFIMKNTLDGG
jgi:hypothetical protein